MAVCVTGARALLFMLLAAPMFMAWRVSASAAPQVSSRHGDIDVPGALSAATSSEARAATVSDRRQLLAEISGPCTNPKACSKPPDHILFMYEVHGWLMSLAWGVLAPAAIVLAYNFRNVGPTSMWFHAHRILMLLAYLMQLAGVGVIVAVMPEYWDFYSRQVMIHVSVGIMVEALAGMQVLAAMVKRPGQASRYRRAWNVAHTWTGRLLLIMGIALIFDGLLLYHSGKPYQHLFILLSAILFFFFAVAAGKDAYDQTGLPPPAVAEEASVKLHGEAAGKLHEIAMPQHNREAVKQLDSACVSPARSTDKLADGDSEKGFPLA